MVINRYYSNITRQNIKFTSKDLLTYKNWEVTDFADNAKVTVQTDGNNQAIFQDVITPGNGHLYSVLPVIKYGGTLLYSETISTPTTLLDNMTVASGCTLIVNSTY